ncbi:MULTISPECIES: zinc dependent phospholipase C family protein [Asticcacaulis]|uniref:zinc dependent phospholipase C family protein n=1 Tax=Asticcacaulis TaxID=76890 RepID=UPI001AE41856|nr:MULTISPECIES: zinc dependent phospholipase C family protein [Asticcacaulis]MBP2161508.1 cell division septation protein DedD [Asticcacaulis solisilvae]MDR6802553.1 cell division septation protein DedD [Asticcacaulis sp. BE141]
MQRKSSRLRAQLMAAVAVLTLTAPTQPAYAWKPKTHIYLAEEALRDALDNGKVTLYETDRATGRIIGVLGEFDVDPNILAALKAGQKQFRAGVLGPDAYPDILTGQQIIHPEEADAIDGTAGGSNAWLTHLWERGFVNGATPQVRAFTIGYLTHAAGDVFAHTYVNHYAGGEFMLVPDPTNAVKHLVLEGYIGKRTPQTMSATTTRQRVSGGPRNPRKRDDLGLDPDTTNDPIVYENIRLPITQEDTSIAGVEGFIYDELTVAKPGSIMMTKLMKGEGTGRSIPFIFSEKRNQLQAEVDDYERTRLGLSGPARLAYAAANGVQAEYKKAWIADIDAGLKAFPAVSHEVAKAIVYNEAGGDMGRAKDILSKYVSDHMYSMVGIPDAVIITARTISNAVSAIVPPVIAEFLNELLMAPLDAIIKGLTGKSPDEWAHYMTNPEAHFDEIMNVPGGGHSGSVEHRIDLKTFNREQLKIDDDGYGKPSLKWKIEDLPPAFNTLQLTKLLFLGDAGMRQLQAALKAKGVEMGAAPRNYMLGWVRSLDAGNQWQGLASPRGKASPQAAFAGNGAAAYNRLFLAQIGEAEIPAAGPASGPAPATPAPTAPAPQPAPPVKEPRWSPRPEDRGNRSLMASYLEGDWATDLGRLRIKRTGEGDVDHWIGHIYRAGRNEAGFVLEDLVPSDDASGLTGTWREAGSTQKRAIRLVLNLNDGDRFAGGAEGYIGGLAELTGTRILNPPAHEAPEPQPTEPQAPVPEQPGPQQPAQRPQPPAPQPQPPEDDFQPLGKWDVRIDKVENPRDDRLTHVYVTLRNASTQVQYQTGEVWVYLEDTSGATQRSGQGVRAIPGPPQLFSGTPTVFPGKTIKAKYVFDRVRGAAITGITVTEGEYRAEFAF